MVTLSVPNHGPQDEKPFLQHTIGSINSEKEKNHTELEFSNSNQNHKGESLPQMEMERVSPRGPPQILFTLAGAWD